jgi:hypothetical protein
MDKVQIHVSFNCTAEPFRIDGFSTFTYIQRNIKKSDKFYVGSNQVPPELKHWCRLTNTKPDRTIWPCNRSGS